MTKAFKLNNVPAVLRSVHVINASTIPMGERAKPTKVFEVELVLDIDPVDAMSGVEFLFLDADAWCKMVAGTEGENAGEDRHARTKLPDQDMVLTYGEKKDMTTVASGVAAIKKKAVLGVNDEGKVKLVLKPRVKLEASQMVEACMLIEADMRVSMTESTQQLPLIDDVPPEEPGESTKNETTKKKAAKGKKAAEKTNVVPIRASDAKAQDAADKLNAEADEEDPFEETASNHL
jgi:hypothetical protein